MKPENSSNILTIAYINVHGQSKLTEAKLLYLTILKGYSAQKAAHPLD